MNKIITDVVSALLGVAAVAWLTSASTASESLLGIGILLIVGVYQLRIIAEEQRAQTVLLLLIAEGQDAE